MLRTIVILVTVAVGAASYPLCALGRPQLHPTKEQGKATELIVRLMGEQHYKQTQLNDALSSSILDKYLETLDPNRSYFTSKDIRRFGRNRYRFDDDLRKARLDTAFSMFNVFRDRVEERVRYALSLLGESFDFNVDEDYVLDRSEIDWPKDRKEQEELWRKRVKNDVLSLRLAGEKVPKIRETLKSRYQGLARRTRQLDEEDAYQFFMNAYTVAVEPHTSYLSPRASENFMISMSLSLEGIGAVLQNENEFTLVRKLVPGGPAEQSGQLHSEDRIVGVAQGTNESMRNVIGWRLDDVVDLIRGPKGTQVRLDVLPKTSGLSGPTKIITITRNKIELEEQAAKSRVIEVPNGSMATRIGVIEVPTFYIDFSARSAGRRDYRSTTRDVRNLIEKLTVTDKVEGIIIDLRGNGGGSLSEATALTGLFIETGPIVQVKDANGEIEINDDPDPSIAYAGPLAVLVDRFSASASEIFAAAIQDYRRGIIIGEPTFGKGTVQNLIDLDRQNRRSNSRLGQLKVTIAQFFRVNGDSTQHRGVIPDIQYPLLLEPDDHGERAFDNALPWARVKRLSYVPAGAPVDAFTSARVRHEQRIKSNRAFQVLLEEAEATKDARTKTSVSLLESMRRQEREESKRRQEERERRFRTALGLPPLSEDENPDDAAENEDEEDPKKDVLLTEAAWILNDLIVPPAPDVPQRQAGWSREGSNVVDAGRR